MVIYFAFHSLIRNFAAMFEKNIEEYESIRQEYQLKITDRMGEKQWMEYNEILFSLKSADNFQRSNFAAI